jgi:hypothetical protein
MHVAILCGGFVEILSNASRRSIARAIQENSLRFVLARERPPINKVSSGQTQSTILWVAAAEASGKL